MKSAIQFLLYTAKGFKSRIGMILLIGLAEVASSLAFVWISKAVIDVATGVRAGELLYYSLALVGLAHVVNLRLNHWHVHDASCAP